MHNNKFVVIDIETTGLDSTVHEIIEIGCVFFKYDIKKNMYVIESTFESKIAPVHIENADPQALKVNKYSKTEWEGAPQLKKVLTTISKKLKDRVVIGHNVGFDYYFLNNAFKQVNIQNPLHYHTLDTISLAYGKLHKEKEVERLSLSYLCKYFGIENKKSHSALSDALATFELFKRLVV